MSESERRCRNCGLPIVRSGFVWLHLPIEPEGSAFRYCTIRPHKALTSNPHAEPQTAGDLAIAAVDAAFPPTPLNLMARRINRLAQTLPRGHECEPIFAEFDALGEYVGRLEARIDVLEAQTDQRSAP